MTRWNLLLALLIAFGLQLGCHEDLDEATGSDEISELAETTQLTDIIDISMSTTGKKQIVTFTNLNQYEKPVPDPDDTACYSQPDGSLAFGPTRMPNCTGAPEVDGCTPTEWFGDGKCDDEYPDHLNCAATGWDGGDCANASRDEVEFFAYHNGCVWTDATPGLCHQEMVAAGHTTSHTPSDIIRSYDDITMVFTYVAEAVQAIVSIALTVVTAGAASPLIAAEVAEAAGDAASAFLEITEGTVDAAEVGADAADFADDFLNLSVRTTSGGSKYTWAEKLAVKMSVNGPLGMIEGGLKGGYYDAGAAFKGGLEAFGNTVAGSVEGIGGAKGFLNFAKSLGSTAEAAAFTGIKDIEMIAGDAEKGFSTTARLRNFAAHLWNSAGNAQSDRPSYVINALAKSCSADTHPSLFQAVVNELNLLPKAGTAMKLVMTGKMLALQIIGNDGDKKAISFHRTHIQNIVDHLSSDPSFQADVSDYVRQNVPIERGIRALAVAHNLWINAPELRDKLPPLFENKEEVSDLYKDHLPPAMLTGAETLNGDYHLAISAEDHTLYARLNPTFTAGNLEPAILAELSSRDFKTEGYAVAAATLKTAGYLPLHQLTSVETQNVQNLMMCTRIAMGMPVSIKLWSNKEWTYIAGYRGKRYLNIAGFLRDGVSEDAKPSYDHWVAPWYAPGHPKHNTFWEEIVSYPDQVGTYKSTQTTFEVSAPLRPATKNIFINENNSLHMEVTNITDDELAQWNANGEPASGWNDGCGPTKDRLIIVTLKAAEAVSWWKGLNVTVPGYDATTCVLNGTNDHNLEVKADGAPMTLYIPMGRWEEFLSLVDSLEPDDFKNGYLSTFKFKVENCCGAQYPIGETSYSLDSLVGKHITVTWVTEGSSGSDFYGAPGTYKMHGDVTDVVVSTQESISGSDAQIGFEINAGIGWWKGIALRKSDGSKLWLTKNDLTGTPDSGFTSTASLSSTNPVSDWGYHVHVEFWKEVTPGVNYYQKSVKIKTEDLVGYRTTFEWKYDGTNYGPIEPGGYKADGGRDSIGVQIEDGGFPDLPGFPDGLAEVRFAAAPGVTWWKAIKVVYMGGSTGMLVTHTPTQTTGLNPTDGSDYLWVYPAVLPSGGELRIEFWKEETPGVNYYVGDAKIDYDSIKGKIVTFIWENDFNH